MRLPPCLAAPRWGFVPLPPPPPPARQDWQKKHELDRKAIQELVCALCQARQPVSASCVACGVDFGAHRGPRLQGAPRRMPGCRCMRSRWGAHAAAAHTAPGAGHTARAASAAARRQTRQPCRSRARHPGLSPALAAAPQAPMPASSAASSTTTWPSSRTTATSVASAASAGATTTSTAPPAAPATPWPSRCVDKGGGGAGWSCRGGRAHVAWRPCAPG